MPVDLQIIEIAKHNLHVLKAEVDSVKQAIMSGRLWEYVMQKARSHPKLMEAVQIFRNIEMMEWGTPIFKERAIFFFEPIDQYRPEANRFRRKTASFQTTKKKLVICPEGNTHPFYCTRNYSNAVKKFPDAQICSYNPFLGIIPVEISDLFPASHNLTSRLDRRPNDYPTFIDSLKAFAGGFEEIMIVADDFLEQVVKAARLNVRLVDDISAV